ncbi:MAG TPA: lipid-binding SYLF domain-containing protein [Acetobacteraceae bacterium]|nr:lipid-binding SYLF domain-containing protein [Acetobacteraceae bacterium]
MKRILMAAALTVLPGLAHAQTEMQSLVDRSALTLQDAMNWRFSEQPRISLGHARAAVICPRVFKAGFMFAGSGGDCVLVARAANGTWSYPAFYTIGSASFGLQIGLQDSEVLMLIMTDRGLDAIMNSSFKIGAGASVAVAVLGGGVQGDTTTAVGADVLVFSIARGAFAGISLEGTVLNSRNVWDQAYYGQPLNARQIVIQMQGRNPGADPLREVLTRYGTAGPEVAVAPPYQAVPAVPPPPGYPPMAGAPAPAGYAAPPASSGAPINLQPGAPIQQQTLPPPR